MSEWSTIDGPGRVVAPALPAKDPARTQIQAFGWVLTRDDERGATAEKPGAPPFASSPAATLEAANVDDLAQLVVRYEVARTEARLLNRGATRM